MAMMNSPPLDGAAVVVVGRRRLETEDVADQRTGQQFDHQRYPGALVATEGKLGARRVWPPGRCSDFRQCRCPSRRAAECHLAGGS